jgi:hypothetical protein
MNFKKGASPQARDESPHRLWQSRRMVQRLEQKLVGSEFAPVAPVRSLLFHASSGYVYQQIFADSNRDDSEADMRRMMVGQAGL